MKRKKSKAVPLAPEDINALMEDNEDARFTEALDERTEGELLAGMQVLRRECGDEGLEEAMIQLILPYERELRANEPADHPALVLLDEWRADKRWK